MSEYWSAKPFISHDGPDESGLRAEVRVKKGLGMPVALEDSEKGKAAKLSIDNGHPKYKSGGWIPKDDPLYAVAKEALDNGEPLEFRVENKRRVGVDRSIPIERLLAKDAEQPSTETVTNSVVALRREGEEWVFSPLALTRLDEDPAPHGARSANDFTPEELGIGASPAAPRREEGGPASPAVAVPITILNFVHDYYEKMGVADIVDEEHRRVAVQAILRACNAAQVKVCGLERADMGAHSHTRARQIIFLVLERYLPLRGETLQDREALSHWMGEAVKKTVAIWRWSAAEVEKLS